MQKLIAFGAVALMLVGCGGGNASSSSQKGVSKGCKKTQRFTCDPVMSKKKQKASKK
jgi:phosphoribosylformylglycinamidine (FGAM) synthase-like enzyme